MATILQTIIGKLTATVEKVSATVATVEYRNKLTAAVETTSKTLLNVYTSSTKYFAETTAKTVLQDAAYVGKTSLSYIVGKFVEIYFKVFGDTGQVTDTASTGVGKGLSDSASLEDSKVYSFDKALQNTGQVQDSLSRQTTYTRQYQDTAAITDTAAIGSIKLTSENLSLSDVTGIVNIYNRNPEDGVLSTDDVNGAGADDDQNITFFKVTGDFTQVFDLVSFQNAYNRQFSDSSNLTDEDRIETGKFFYHSAGLQDSLNIVTSFLRNPQDTTQIIDNKYFESTKGINSSLGLSDNFATATSYFREFSSSITATDDLNGAATDDDQNITFFKNTGDLTAFVDITQIVSIFNRAFNDTAAVVDTTQVAYVKVLEDTVSLQDTTDVLLDYGRVPYDLVTATDDVNGAGVDDDQNIVFFKNLPSELLSIASIAAKSSEKGVTEILQITSQGVILNQNYGADYFAQDYVGVSRSFT